MMKVKKTVLKNGYDTMQIVFWVASGIAFMGGLVQVAFGQQPANHISVFAKNDAIIPKHHRFDDYDILDWFCSPLVTVRAFTTRKEQTRLANASILGQNLSSVPKESTEEADVGDVHEAGRVVGTSETASGSLLLRASKRLNSTQFLHSSPIQVRTATKQMTVSRVPPTNRAPHEGVFLFDPSQGATPAFDVALNATTRWREAEVRSAAGREIGAAVSARRVPLALGQVEFLWRQDTLGSNATYRELADWMKTHAADWSLLQLKYIGFLFTRQADGHNFQVKPVNAWTDGNQEGYGSLTSKVPLSVGVESIDPAIVVLKPRVNLSPGLYRFRQGPYTDAKETYFLIGGLNVAEEEACVNIWRGDQDFGRPLVKPCKAGSVLSAIEREQLELGRLIRQKLDRILPGWQISKNRTSLGCFAGSPWPTYTAWGDFDGDGREDHAVQVYRGRSLRLILFFNRPTGLEPLVAYIGEPLEEEWKELPGDYPGLDVARAGTRYHDHERNIGGKFAHDTVVQVYCEKSAIAYIYQQGVVRRVFISD